MPIELRTGLPGAGKSLGAVERLMELQEKHPDRPRFVLGITNLREDLATVINEDQLRDWQSFPAGSVIFVDECQKWMPSRRSGDPPGWIKDLSTHRHLGLDFVLITQHPALIDTYVRRLIDRHIHTVRKYGTSYVERWQFGECVSEPTSKAIQKGSESKTLVKFNPKAMQAYTSAEMHTVERRIPRFVIVGAVLVLLVPMLAFLAIHVMRRLGHADDKPAVTSSAEAAPAGAKGSASGKGRERPMTRDEWLARFTPRVAGMPWSAPAYDDRKVEGTPDLFCIIMDVGEADEHCRCNTEQGTRASVPDSMCKTMAREGTYNPYRKAPEPMQDATRGRQPGTDPAPVEVVSAVRPAITKTQVPGRSADTPEIVSARIGTHYLPPDKTTVSSSFDF